VAPALAIGADAGLSPLSRASESLWQLYSMRDQTSTGWTTKPLGRAPRVSQPGLCISGGAAPARHRAPKPFTGAYPRLPDRDLLDRPKWYRL